MFAQQIRLAVKVTRANEARRMDFMNQVREEHEKIVAALVAGDPDRARAAAGDHLLCVAARVRLADRDFWAGSGGELARDLVRD
jgi:DNA-binding FadR family transcriptional regulator